MRSPLKQPGFFLALILLAFALATGCAGWNYYQRQKHALEDAARDNLEAIADLKVFEIEQWRKERLNDARWLLSVSMIRPVARDFLNDQANPKARTQLLEWMKSFREFSGYSRVVLLDSNLQPCLAAPEPDGWIGPLAASKAAVASRTNQVIISDMHLSAVSHRVNMDYLVPLLPERTPDNTAASALGVFLLEVEPKDFLFPLIKKWPTPSRTAEVLLVRREGDELVYLNELRHRTNTALQLRLPLAGNTNLPAQLAVMGKQGTVRGLDYRNQPVLAALRSVADSPWSLVAKQDLSEIEEPVRKQVLIISSLVAVFVLAATLGMGFLWRSHKYFLSLEEIERREKTEAALRESERNYREVFNATSDAIFVHEMPEGRLVDVNEAMLKIYGYESKEEALACAPQQMNHDQPPYTMVEAGNHMRLAVEEGPRTFEWLARRKTGELFWVEVALRCSTIAGHQCVLAAVRDITGRKKADERVRQLASEQQTILNTINMGISLLKNRRLQWVNPAFSRIFGYEPREIMEMESLSLYLNRGDYERVGKEGYARLAAGAVYTTEVLMKNKDGAAFWCRITGQAINPAALSEGSIWILQDISERKQAEEALDESRRLLRLVLDTIPVRVFWKDTERRYLGCNRSFARDAGFDSAEELTGKTDYDMAWGNQAEFYRTDDQRIITTGVPKLHYEEPQTTSAGTQLWLRTSKIPLRNLEGRIIGVLGTYEDITERKRAEESLRESQALYYSFVEQLPTAVFRKDAEGRYVMVNSQFCRLKSMKAEDFLGKKPREVAASVTDGRDKSGQATKYAGLGEDVHERIMRTGKSFETEEEYPDANRGQLFMHIARMPVFDPDGKVIGSQGIMFDITERKRAEETLARERRLLRTLIDLLPEIFYIKDLDGRFIMANEALARQWGKADPSQLLGLSDENFFPAKQAAEYRAEELKVFAGESVVGRESLCVFADGGKHTMLTTKIPFRDNEGQVCGLVGIGYDITERKRVEEALRESEAQLRGVLDSTPFPVALVDVQDNNILYWSRSALTLFGHTAPTAAEWYQLAYPDPDYRREVIERWKPCLEKAKLSGEAVNTGECRVTCRDGSVLICELFATFLPDRLIVTFNDITERKRAEQALKESESLLRRSQSVSRLGSYYMDAATGAWIGSPALDEIFGIDKNYPKDVTGWVALVHPEDKDAMLDHLRNHVLAGRNRFERAYRIIRPDNGQERWVHGLGELEFDAGGKPVRMIGTIQDITERKQVEAVLRESEDRFRKVFEEGPMGMAMVTLPAGRFFRANAAFCEMLGYTEEELTRLTFVDVTHPDHRIQDIEAVRRMREGAIQKYAGEKRYLKKNGEAIWAARALTNIRSADGKSFYALAMIEDITERKRSEEELRRKNEELGRFTYTVSHDLKSPLITIKGFTGALQQDIAAGRHQRLETDLKRIADATDKMSELLNDLLELSRIGRIMHPPSDVALGQLVPEVLELLAGPIKEGGVNISVQADLPVVKGDRRRLMEVFQNLVENSIRFMGKQPRPHVEIGMRNEGGERVFFVRDNGAGIEPRYHDTVFGLFNKLDAKSAGTGIGLALVRRIIEVHGGTIWVESEGQNKGSAFCFTLPEITTTRKEQQT